MTDILFYIFAFLTLVCGFLVVANPFSRNPVTSAMFLVLTIISLAGLFVLLHAFFLAAVQVLVYAGAVMVLFLFVIMMLDLKAEEREENTLLGVVGGLVVGRRDLFHFSPEPAAADPVLPADTTLTAEGGTVELGKLAFHPIPAPI